MILFLVRKAWVYMSEQSAVEIYSEPISEKAKETLDQIRSKADEIGWWVQDTDAVLHRGAISVEPLVKKTAGKVEIVTINGDSGSLNIDTFKPTHGFNDKRTEGSVVAEIKLSPYAGDRGRINDAQGQYQLLSTGRWMVNEPMKDGKPYVREERDTPSLLNDYLLRTPTALTGKERRFYANDGDLRRHVEEAMQRYYTTHSEQIDRAGHIVSEGDRMHVILANISGSSDRDSKIPDEDRVILGFAANTELAKK